MRTIFNRIRSVSLGKATLALLLALVLILSLLPVSTLAEETDEARWVVQSGTDTPASFTDSGTLDEAIEAANSADSSAWTYIQLCRDVTVSNVNYSLFYLDYDQYAVLDLGGYTLSAAGNGYVHTVMNSGTLLVRNGTVSAFGSDVAAIHSDGNTILESGTFTATRTVGAYPYYLSYGVYQEGGEIHLGNVTKIEGTDADIFLTYGDSLFANDGAATPTYYNGSALTISSVEPAIPEYGDSTYPYIRHGEVLISGLNSANKDKFILSDVDAEFFQTRYDEANSCLTLEGKPMSLTWYDEDGTVLTGTDYPTSLPFASVIEALPTVTKEGKEFVGWMHRQADSELWRNYFMRPYFHVVCPLEAKAVFLYDLTPVTDDTGTYIPIRTAEDLMALSAIINSGYKYDEYNVNSVTYRLMNDIDMSQVCGEDIGSFIPIGNWDYRFNANFDGNGKTISNLYVSRAEASALFFRLGSDVTIKDLTVSGDFISDRSAYVLFANAGNNLTLANCTLLGTVYGSVGYSGAYGEYSDSPSFTNVDTSDVVILPPENYTTTPGGYMAYGPTSPARFDVIGSYNGRLIPTTYGNYGYDYMTADMNGAKVAVSGSPIGGGRYVKLTYTVTAGDTAVTAGKLAVHADIMVGRNDNATVRVIKSGDKVIGISLLDEDESNDTFGAQFSLYFADSAGVTNADTYWFGYYNHRDIHAFDPLNSETASPSSDYHDDYSALYDEDSGFAISWQNIALNPGESKSFSLTLGVGEAVDPIVWGNPDVTLSATTTDVRGRVNVTAKVKDVAGMKDTLYASVDNGAEMQLTTVTAVDGETSATAALDLFDYAPGEHQVTFWFVNEEGSMTPAVTKTVTVTAPVAGKFQDATPSTNMGSAKPTATPAELEQAVPLTDSEKQANDRGEDVLIWLETKDATDTVSAASKDAIAKALGDKKLGMYLDVSLFKKVGDAEAQALTQLNKKITITMKVPTELLPESEAQGRVYYIVRTHNGVVDLLDTTFDAKAGTITFETDRFSNYAIAYSDIVTSPATGDIFSTALWVTLMAISAAAFVGLLAMQKKRSF